MKSGKEVQCNVGKQIEREMENDARRHVPWKKREKRKKK